jgi:hypothetical protein
MRRVFSVAWALVCLAAATAAVAGADTTVVNQNGQRRTYDCHGGAVTINGNRNDLTLVDCPQVAVNGNANTVEAGTVKELSLFGSRNKVTWTAGASGRPRIVNFGTGNRVNPSGAAATESSARTSSRSGGDSGSSATTVRAGESGVEVRGEGGSATVSGAGDGRVTVASGGSKVTVDGSGSIVVGGAGQDEDAAAVVVNEGDLRRAYDCHGGSAVVNGGNNFLTLRNCRQVVVNGSDNTIDAGTARSIRILGSDNKVTWTAAADGSRPSVSDQGADNVVGQRR